MPNRTFAFSHRGGYWKTRYSFFSSCYAYVNKALLSFRLYMTTSQRDPVWRHNQGPINSFYNAVAGSGFSVSFNQKPSQNKILKSVSIEGTNNADPASIIIANNSTTANQAKESPVIAFDDKGGILYGGIQGQSTNTNGNVKLMGALYPAAAPTDQVAIVEEDGQYYLYMQAPFTWADGGGSNVTGNAKYAFGLPAGNMAGIIFANEPNDINDELTTNFAGVPEGVLYNGYFQDTGEAQFRITGTQGDLEIILEEILAQPYLSVYSITPNNTYGDMLKGQYADAIFTLGSNDWEIMSVNLEYEPTTYDHDGPSAMPSTSRGKRSRRR